MLFQWFFKMDDGHFGFGLFEDGVFSWKLFTNELIIVAINEFGQVWVGCRVGFHYVSAKTMLNYVMG